MVSLVSPRVIKALALGAVQIPQELQELFQMIEGLEPTNVMEIGSEAGGTFYLWCKLAKGIKISLDLPTGTSGSGRFAAEMALASRTKMFKSWATDVHVVTGDSHLPDTWHDVNDILRDQKLDFLFIDGDHSYEGVKKDYEDYRYFVKEGGLIGFHDINDTEYHRKHGCYVANFWNELEGDKREINQRAHWGGVGLLRN